MLAASLRSVITVRHVEVDGATIQVEAEGAAPDAACPACGLASRRIHDRYCRRPADLPWRGYAVRLILTVRSFCCDNAACARATFVEDFGDALPRRSRWTREAAQFLQQVAGAAGGEAGARVAAAAGVAISADTLLRLQRADTAVEPAPRRMVAVQRDGLPPAGRPGNIERAVGRTGAFSFAAPRAAQTERRRRDAAQQQRAVGAASS